RPKPVKPVSAISCRSVTNFPFESACAISIRASLMGLPAPSITWPVISMRVPGVSSRTRTGGNALGKSYRYCSGVNPYAKKGPTVWEGVWPSFMGLFLHRGLVRAAQYDVENVTQRDIGTGDIDRE